MSTLELIAESVSTSTSKAGNLSLQVREIERTSESVHMNSMRPTESVKGIVVTSHAHQVQRSDEIEEIAGR